MDWTWSQIELAATAVQAYHHELAHRLVTGKSPVVEEAVQVAERARRLAAEAPATLDRATRAAMAQAAEDRMMAAQVAGMGFSVSTGPAAPIDGMALFRIAQEAKARGEDPSAALQAAMRGDPPKPAG